MVLADFTHLCKIDLDEVSNYFSTNFVETKLKKVLLKQFD